MKHPINPQHPTAKAIVYTAKGALTLAGFWLYFVTMWALSSPQLGGM